MLLHRSRKAVKRLLSNSERTAMELSLAAAPLGFPLISRTGGFRKARWGRSNQGKSGGVRAIFYYFVSGQTIFLEFVYAKNEKGNLTLAEEKQLKRLAEEIEKHEA